MNYEINTKSKVLNIAMLGHKRIPSREGGIEIVVEELSCRMVKKGHKVTCYNRRGHHVSGKEFDSSKKRIYKGVRLVTVLTINCKGLAAVSSSLFSSIIVAFKKYDIVHIHAEGPAFLCWLPKLLGKRVIVTVHGLDHQRAKWGRFASKYIMAGEKNAVKYADEIIVLSEGVKEYFQNTYGRKTIFIPNGVNRPEIKKANVIKRKWDLERDGYILFLGRIVPEKGLKYLIEAFMKVQTNKKLVIAGGSSDTDSFLQELKDMSGSDKRIMFTGFVQGEILEELYSNAYIYCLPSDLEGMPLSLLEAMSYGNCCVVSDIPECSEVVEDKAVVFSRGNVKELIKSLQGLCDNEKLVKHYKDISADFICEKYDWDYVVDRTLDSYMCKENKVEKSRLKYKKDDMVTKG